MRYALLAALLVAGCSTPQAPNPIAPIARVDLKPVKDRVIRVEVSGGKVDTQLEATRYKLDAAIVDAHQQKEQNASLDANLQAAKSSLTEAMAERKRQADEITFLKIDVNAAQEQEDAANLKANAAVDRANVAEGKVYKYELQEQADKKWWGLAGVWRWTKHLGWRVIFLLVGLAIVGFLLNMFVPLARPILNTMAMFFVGLGKTLWGLILKILPSKRPP